jgi:hypothetical protein
MIKSWYAGLLMLVLFSFTAYAADSPRLEWDANDDADYYVVYWSKTPNAFTEANSIDVPGDITYLELVASPGGEEYYYTVKAFNDYGNSSDFSEPVLSAHLPLALYAAPVEKETQPTAGKVSAGNSGGGGCFIETVI